ncbi:membrane protein (plasmid) [Aliivibrio wodanis]|uniref:Membrane protein n=1 Tax=Aliivibrio wodanis TaxID=80852 RepID=A0A090K2M4_9GAMM|nr:membrane protein [Aliivibrio wodanis]
MIDFYVAYFVFCQILSFLFPSLSWAFFAVAKGSFPRCARPPITPIRKKQVSTASGFLSSFSPTQKQHQKPVAEPKSRAFSSLSKCL